MPKIVLKSLRVDKKKEAEGVWKERAELPGVSFLVRSALYPPFDQARNAMIRRLARQHGQKPIPTDDISEALGALLADHILLDWKGFDEEYTPELAMEYLTDPEFRTLVNAVEGAALDASQANLEFIEDSAKN